MPLSKHESLESIRFCRLFRIVQKISKNLIHFQLSRINIKTLFWKIIEYNIIYNYRKTQRKLARTRIIQSLVI